MAFEFIYPDSDNNGDPCYTANAIALLQAYKDNNEDEVEDAQTVAQAANEALTEKQQEGMEIEMNLMYAQSLPCSV